MSKAVRVGDTTAHGQALNGSGSPDVFIGNQKAWRAMPPGAGTGLDEVSKSVKEIMDKPMPFTPIEVTPQLTPITGQLIKVAGQAEAAGAKGASTGVGQALVKFEITFAAISATYTSAMTTPGEPAARLKFTMDFKKALGEAMDASVKAIAGPWDMHSCPATIPPPAPHGSGVVIKGCQTVFINGLPAVNLDHLVIEGAGGPTKVQIGCSNVFIGDQAPASGGSGSSCATCEAEAKSGTAANWDVDSILKTFCGGDSEDKAVVSKLPKLTVHMREAKQVHFKKFQGGKWVDGGFTSGGSANGTTVRVNAQTSSSEAASTLYHEVIHTDQPSSMAGSLREYDAYIKEEKWRIKKGLPSGGPNFRKTIPDPNDPKKTIEVPDEDAIKARVDAVYAYNPPAPSDGSAPPPAVVGVTPDGKEVRLADGTTRAPIEGDAYRLPDTGGKTIETIDPKKWKCP
jgi:uncharacterized Zn-binding protein involved in type VI secretion